MLHYTPSSSVSYNPGFFAPSDAARERYLTALAEARAAEAEYLALEAERREEEALRHRLHEIELRKQHDLLRSLHGQSALPGCVQRPYTLPNTYPGLTAFQAYPSTFIGSFGTEEACASNLAFIGNADPGCVHHCRSIERAGILPNLRKGTATQCGCESLKPLVLEGLAAPKCVKDCHIPRRNFSCNHTCLAGQGLGNHQKSVPHGLRDSDSRPPTTSGNQPKENEVAADAAQRLLSTIFGNLAQQAPGSTSMSCADALQQLLQASLPASHAVKTSPSDSRPSVPAVPVGPQDFLKSFFGFDKHVSSPSVEKKAEPKPSSSAKLESVGSVESTLKAELESRLNNEFASEVRDTIQAILASLQEPQPSYQTSTATTADSSSGSKGKAKATDRPSSPSNPTFKDVVNAMNEVRTIEAAFTALESDFAFPSQLDFTDMSPLSNSGSVISRLAFTARNHPVRFYEQALSTLLSKLDSVDSFGNEELRTMRREVVGMVEKALEDLESEVEGRWKSNAAKAAKAKELEEESVKTTPSAAVEADADVQTSSEPKSSDNVTPLADTVGHLTPADVAEDQFNSPPVNENGAINDLLAGNVPVVEAAQIGDIGTVEHPQRVDQAEDMSTSDVTIQPVAVSTVASGSPSPFLLQQAEPPSEDSPRGDSDVNSDWSEL